MGGNQHIKGSDQSTLSFQDTSNLSILPGGEFIVRNDFKRGDKRCKRNLVSCLLLAILSGFAIVIALSSTAARTSLSSPSPELTLKAVEERVITMANPDRIAVARARIWGEQIIE